MNSFRYKSKFFRNKFDRKMRKNVKRQQYLRSKNPIPRLSDYSNGRYSSRSYEYSLEEALQYYERHHEERMLSDIDRRFESFTLSDLCNKGSSLTSITRVPAMLCDEIPYSPPGLSGVTHTDLRDYFIKERKLSNIEYNELRRLI